MNDKMIGRSIIALVGMPGTGKTTVGGMIADRVAYALVDPDAIIVAREGWSISEIFQDKGEQYYRKVEGEILSELLGRSNIVIATGGGMGANPTYMAALKENAFVVRLNAKPQKILERLKRAPGGIAARPLLQGGDPEARLAQILGERENVYSQAHFTIQTDEINPAWVAKSIVAEFMKRCTAHPDKTKGPRRHNLGFPRAD